MNKLDINYQELLQDILDNGHVKGDRTGTGTLSVFGRQIRHNMKDGFPLLTTKKIPFKLVAIELIWFLKGDTNIKYLVDNGCNIWNGDTYKNYLNSIKTGKLNYDMSGRAFPDNPHDISNWNKYYFNDSKYYQIVGLPSHAEWEEVNILTIDEFIDKIKIDDEFAKKWGELGPIYGRQWREWTSIDSSEMKMTTYGIDQIKNLIQDLRENPDSRRLMVNAWNVAELDEMVLPPCHYGFQMYTRELSLEERLLIADKFNPLIREACLTKISPDQTPDIKLIEQHEWLDKLGPNVVPQRRAISLMWNQRSVDTFLGLPFNIASYGLLLEIIAKDVNMVPDQLIGNLGDTHLYSNHLEQAIEQIGRESFDLPKIEINDSWKFGSSSPIFADKLKLEMFDLIGYESQGVIKAPLSN